MDMIELPEKPRKVTRIGAWIHARLNERDPPMSLSDLARRMGTHTGTLSRWVSGQNQPTATLLIQLAKVLDADLDELYELAGLRQRTARDDPAPLAELVGQMRRAGLTARQLKMLSAMVAMMRAENEEARALQDGNNNNEGTQLRQLANRR